ncbi:MAG: DUF87 domain-containing protein, partial [Candidatus Aenigmarchaeota archaeon]|nr:DUF87 domain-containing protein [Candidatus Aenigmarchaeota archaeon]
MDSFRKDVVGRLLWAEPDPNTRFKYTIWFDYTRKLVNELHEGDLVAVPNFATDSNEIRYSILQLVTVMPWHYALGTNRKDLRGYPGFLMQAAKSASADWTEQETESYEDTTKIICEAIPTNLEYDENNSEEPIQSERAMAMVGKDVYILTSEMTERIFNRGINKEVENVIVVGDLIRDRDVKIYVRVEDLIKTHFGIFGFTGVGKSNLVSTIVSSLLSTDQPIKIILFDLMDEYTGLLVDQLLTHNGKIICLGEKTLMKPVFEYVNGDSKDLEFAVNTFLKNLLLPKGLKGEKRKFRPLIKEILQNGEIKIFEETSTKTVEDFLNDIWPDVENHYGSKKKGMLNKMKNDVFGKHLKDELTPELAQEFINKLGFGGEFRTQPIASVNDVLKESDLKEKLQYTLIEYLRQIVESSKIRISENAKIDMQQIVNDLNDESKPSLYIV